MSGKSWRAAAILALVPVAAAFVPAPSAEAQVRSLRITGEVAVGERLRAIAKPSAAPAPRFQWLRCAPTMPRSCEAIDGATRSWYLIGDGDAGHRLAVRARRRSARRVSALTVVVPDPDPPPYALPLPLQYLEPFPVVRLKGQLSRGGARLTLVRVAAPPGSLVRVRCTGPSCPALRRSRDPGRIRPLERYLPAGTRIAIRVTQSDFIGKYVRIDIRDGRAPARRDACVLPGRKPPGRCPSL